MWAPCDSRDYMSEPVGSGPARVKAAVGFQMLHSDTATGHFPAGPVVLVRMGNRTHISVLCTRLWRTGDWDPDPGGLRVQRHTSFLVCTGDVMHWGKMPFTRTSLGCWANLAHTLGIPGPSRAIAIACCPQELLWDLYPAAQTLRPCAGALGNVQSSPHRENRHGHLSRVGPDTQ